MLSHRFNAIASTSSVSNMTTITDDDCSVNESELFDSLASMDFDINLHDVLDDDDADGSFEIGTTSDSLSTNTPRRRISHFDAVDLALVLYSDENGRIEDFDGNDLQIDPNNHFSVQMISTTMELEPANHDQYYEIDNIGERTGIISGHDSGLSFDEVFAKLQECMDRTSVTRKLMRQFTVVENVDNDPYYQQGGTEIPHSAKHDSFKHRQKIVKCRTARKVKTEPRLARTKLSALKTGVRPINWSLI
jgi:hypothetical protein